MEITINNQLKQLAEHTSISVQALLNLEIPEKQKGLAVAINNIVVSKTDWENKMIANKDNVLIIKATQGG
jgi:sulfur carrier protein